MKVWEKLKTELNHKGLNTLSDNELKKISNNILKRSPRQCPQCGRWFLLNNNKDIKFCSQKCCVDYCNRKDYDSKVKSKYYIYDEKEKKVKLKKEGEIRIQNIKKKTVD